MPKKPSVNRSDGGDGRDEQGRFARGNRLGQGNPLGHRVARFRQTLFEAVSDEDLQEIAKVLVRQAKAGDMVAIRELLLRLIGKPVESDLLERLDALEAAINKPRARKSR